MRRYDPNFFCPASEAKTGSRISANTGSLLKKEKWEKQTKDCGCERATTHEADESNRQVLHIYISYKVIYV